MDIIQGRRLLKRNKSWEVRHELHKVCIIRLHSKVKCWCLFTSVKICLGSNLLKKWIIRIWKWFICSFVVVFGGLWSFPGGFWSSAGGLSPFVVVCGCLLVVCGCLWSFTSEVWSFEVVCGHLLVVCCRLWRFRVATCFSNYVSNKQIVFLN